MEKKNGGSLVSAAATDMVGTEKTKKETEQAVSAQKIIVDFWFAYCYCIDNRRCACHTNSEKSCNGKDYGTLNR